MQVIGSLLVLQASAKEATKTVSSESDPKKVAAQDIANKPSKDLDRIEKMRRPGLVLVVFVRPHENQKKQ